MAGQKLEPMSINSGDPVTAELMQNIISNINIVNSLATGTTTTTTTTGTGGTKTTTTVATVIDSGRAKVACKKDSSGQAVITFNKTFSAAPNIVCSVWNPSAANLVKLKYMPVVTSFTDTEFTVNMLSLGATSEGNVYVTWVASI